MQELEPDWRRTASVWWLIAWRTFLGGWIMALIIGFVAGEIGARLGLAFQPVALFATVLAWLAALAWGFVVLRMALKKHYKEFRLALVKNS